MPLASQREKKKTNALQLPKGMTDEKGQRLLPLASQRGKKKTNALQLTKGMTDEKGQCLLPLASQRGKKKADALQLPKGITEEKGTIRADKASAYCLWRAGGKEKRQRLAATQRHDR